VSDLPVVLAFFLAPVALLRRSDAHRQAFDQARAALVVRYPAAVRVFALLIAAGILLLCPLIPQIGEMPDMPWLGLRSLVGKDRRPKT